MSKTPGLLDKLLRTPGPSGYETQAAAAWREGASFATVSADGIGSSVARIGDASPLLAVVGHIDEIGLVIRHIDEKGFLWFAAIGGWDPQILVGQRVEVQGPNGPVLGVVGRKPLHLLDADARKKVVELKSLHIDIGVGDREEAEALVRVGDPVVIATEPLALSGDRLVSRSMDNRLGAYVALEALRRCHEGGSLKGSFAAIAAVQEEIGLFGARTSAFKVQPDLALVVDVTHATDAPGIDEKELGSHALGSGPVIYRGATLSPKVSELLIDVAEEAGIEHTVGATGNSTSTDADGVQFTRSGIPTGLVSIPLRYMHSPVEMVDLADVEATVALIVAFAERIDDKIDLSR
ncbi:MAG TPA: M42 family metallopeptidase [Solirubrobacterales bacterium]|jgi:endoglucanase|nr:M42 family metallopeptidase [Solirubrobacterales bacterium]